MMTIRPTLLSATALMLGLSLAHAQETTPPSPAMLEALAGFQADQATVAKNLDTFDTLDFEVYSGQKWDRLNESHAQDIVVHYPDGSTTTGIDAHIEALSPMFVFAPTPGSRNIRSASARANGPG